MENQISLFFSFFLFLYLSPSLLSTSSLDIHTLGSDFQLKELMIKLFQTMIVYSLIVPSQIVLVSVFETIFF